MNNKAILNKVKELLGVEVKLEQRKLDDGVTVIEADAFESGAEVMIVTEDEQMIPLPVGEYKMEDGQILIVTEEGIIAEIKSEEAVEQEKDEEEKEEENLEKETDKPKSIVETKVKETYFEEETPEEVVETVESVEEEVVEEVSAIIDDLTPESVSAEDAEKMAESVVEAVTETLEEMPEELKSKYMSKRKKYGKNKMTQEEADIIKEAEEEIIANVAEVVDAETPEEVTPEIAETIAEVVTEAVQEIVADAPEELKKQVFNKTKLSTVKSRNKARILKAKKKIQKLSADNSAAAKPLSYNPENVQKTETHTFAKNRPQNIMDKVLARINK
jgi:hypothetical protein